VACLAVLTGIGAYIWVKNPSLISRFADVASLSTDTLGDEPCDREHILERCNDLIVQSKSRSCLKLSDLFFEKCGDYDELHRFRNAAARKLSEWGIAIDSANKLVERYPVNADMFWIRGNTLEDKGDVEAAAKDYEQAHALMPRGVQPPFHLANIYQRLGRPCDGITPLETFSFYYPDNSENAARLLDQLYRNAQCSNMQGSGKAKIRIKEGGNAIAAEATVNNSMTGRFLIDTGASTVVLSRAFADQAGVAYQHWPTHKAQTANGVSEGHYGYIDDVILQGVEAKHIATMVVSDMGNVDGLLGLSFLGRFKIRMNAEKGYITLTQRR
jgi:aspartyl protease family protein